MIKLNDYIFIMTMKIRENISLKNLNTFGIDVKASQFLEVKKISELHSFIVSGGLQGINFMILGGGSNVLFIEDYQGILIKNSIGGIEVEDTSSVEVIVSAGAGVVWDDLVHFCIDHGLGGIENLVLIPGSVGAGPIQNIGAYGVELKDHFHSLDAIEVATGILRTFKKDECSFGYRDSIFKRELKAKYIIVCVRFTLSRSHIPDISYGAIREELERMGVEGSPNLKAVGEAIAEIRRTKLPDPEKVGNAGSFFKNPLISEKKYEKIRNRYPEMPSYNVGEGLVKVPAGWLIEQCGWKGKQMGNAAVHDKQALVLVNMGHASGKEVLALAEQILASVKNEFAIDLEMEVNVIK